MEKARKPIISLKGVNKVYGREVRAVKDLTLDIYEGDFLCLVGPSGCGKSTTLRMIAGLEDISGGELYIDGEFSNYRSPRERNLAMVFQNYALYPQLSVYDNIAFSLKIKNVPKEEIKKKVFEAARLLSLGPYLDRYPRELSGGQMQRVALGRAIVKECPIYLMDEPLSNLDAKLRVQMRSEIVRLMKELKGTAVYVTHDQTEAMTMASRIVVMNEGYVQQEGSPDEVYGRPSNLFVATFIGNPPMNVVEAAADGEGLRAGGLAIGDGGEAAKALRGFYKGQLKECLALRKVLSSGAVDLLSLLSRKGKSLRWLKSEEGRKALDGLAVLVGEDAWLSCRAGDLLEGPFDPKKAEKDLAAVKEGLLGYLNSARSASTYMKGDGGLRGKKAKKAHKSSQNDLESLGKFLDGAISFYRDSLGKKEIPFRLGFRPEAVKIGEGETEVVLDLVEPLGSSNYLHFPLSGQDAMAFSVGKKAFYSGQKISIALDKADAYLFDPITGRAVYPKENI